MLTQTHLIATVGLACRLENRIPYVLPTSALIIGSITPDLPMIPMTLIALTTDQNFEVIYEQEHWSLISNWWNSIPLFSFLTLISGIWWWKTSPKTWKKISLWFFLLFLAALVHCIFDFFLHTTDGHAHFLPFTDWTFRSPVSYWDPDHHGRWGALLDLSFLLTGGWWWHQRTHKKWIRYTLIATCALTTLTYVVFYWLA